jgi:hypothetical protein
MKNPIVHLALRTTKQTTPAPTIPTCPQMVIPVLTLFPLPGSGVIGITLCVRLCLASYMQHCVGDGHHIVATAVGCLFTLITLMHSIVVSAPQIIHSVTNWLLVYML